jgi:predicted GH43/DUF377 family glycosyl hydrolase
VEIIVNWPQREIVIPQSSLTHVSGVFYTLDVNQLHLALRDAEDSEAGMVWPTTHNHTTPPILSGVTYPRVVEIINDYTVTFECLSAPYTITCVGANHNLADVKNSNPVSLIIGNSAGLITVNTGGQANGYWGSP